ncbi:MAG TPA: hypothetical protein VGW35_25640 [Methylomirabilota bacterium]|nr:hypothetical protein [Methylomirabilota bacterium]
MTGWLTAVPRRPGGRLAAGWAACFVLLALALPLGLRVGAAGTAVRFLAEFLTDGARPWLSDTTEAPRREPLVLAPGVVGDLWRPARRPPHHGLVLVHGLTPEGKDDRRLGQAAGLLARAGLAVLVPDLPAMRRQRLHPGDTPVVAAAIARLAAEPGLRGDRLAVVGISVGIQPALAAAAEPAAAPRVRLVVSLGGYADARELVRYFTTGVYAYQGRSGRAGFDPTLARAFIALNLDLVRDPTDRALVEAALAGQPLPPSAGPEARAVVALLDNRDPARVDGLLAALPAETQALLDALSPARYVRRVAARLVLVHGRDDPAIPYTESLRLMAAADPARTRLILVDLVAHVEGRPPAWRQAWELAKLWTVVYELLRP